MRHSCVASATDEVSVRLLLFPERGERTVQLGRRRACLSERPTKVPTRPPKSVADAGIQTVEKIYTTSEVTGPSRDLRAC